ncbi:MAG TPA: hypothetical protein DD643_00980 [Synechococcus sp. UBA8638]|nr:hypothetical protein [Synechococcus sp. UBA8638]
MGASYLAGCSPALWDPESCQCLWIDLLIAHCYLDRRWSQAKTPNQKA